MLLTSLFEESTKSAVLGWGRGMGHKGHMLLAKAVIHHAQQQNAKPFFVVSRTSLVDPATGQPWTDKPTFTKTKDDPLSPEEKLATYRKVFPQNAEVFSVATPDASTLDKVLAKIAGEGFTKVILIVGEQEKASFSFLTRPDKSGVPPYQRAGLTDLEIISRQDTTEPSSVKDGPEYQEGPRATPMRQVLLDPSKSEEEQFAVWRRDMPDDLSDEEVKDLMLKAKQRMSMVPLKKGAAPVAEDQVDELDVSKTLKFATKAHSKQKYGDKPYISHPRSVASTGKKFFGSAFTTDAIKVALLHDIVEDTPYKLEQLAKMGYAPEVVQAVQLLTKNKNLSYADNIKAIIASGNKLAMMVKYADNYQNFTGNKSDWDADRAAHSQKKYLASLDMLGDVLGVNKHQSPAPVNESVKPQASIIFDTYNPPDKDSIDGWKVAAKTKFWFVGTDKKRKDSKNPLPYEIKLVCMETAWPKVKTHIKNVNNLLELATEAYKETGEIELFVCTNKESEYKKVLQYNGHKGPHGYYDFERITRRAVPYYRHDKSLKTALLEKDKEAFKQATGIDPEKKIVANHVRYEYYDLLEKFLIKRSLSETRLIELEETVRMSAAVKLQRAWDQQQAKSTASRKRGEEYMAQIKQDVANKNKKPDAPKDESVMSFLATPKHSIEKKSTTSSAEMRKYFEKEKPNNPDKIERGNGGKKVQQVYRRSAEEQSVSELFEPSTDYYTLSNGKMVQVNYRPGTDGRSPTPFTDVKVSYVDPALKPQGSSFDSTGQSQRWDAAPDGVKQAIEKFIRQPQQDVEEGKKKGADGKACWKGHRYNGTENGKDKCVPVSESIENKMASLIRLLENK